MVCPFCYFNMMLPYGLLYSILRVDYIVPGVDDYKPLVAPITLRIRSRNIVWFFWYSLRIEREAFFNTLHMVLAFMVMYTCSFSSLSYQLQMWSTSILSVLLVCRCKNASLIINCKDILITTHLPLESLICFQMR